MLTLFSLFSLGLNIYFVKTNLELSDKLFTANIIETLHNDYIDMLSERIGLSREDLDNFIKEKR